MHVGKASECCPILKVDGNEMKSVDRERYLGDILTSDGKINNNIEERVNKGFGKVNDILPILSEVSFQRLESVDKNFMSRICQAPISTPV